MFSKVNSNIHVANPSTSTTSPRPFFRGLALFPLNINHNQLPNTPGQLNLRAGLFENPSSFGFHIHCWDHCIFIFLYRLVNYFPNFRSNNRQPTTNIRSTTIFKLSRHFINYELPTTNNPSINQISTSFPHNMKILQSDILNHSDPFQLILHSLLITTSTPCQHVNPYQQHFVDPLPTCQHSPTQLRQTLVTNTQPHAYTSLTQKLHPLVNFDLVNFDTLRSLASFGRWTAQPLIYSI